jgi:hypothetical protein
LVLRVEHHADCGKQRRGGNKGKGSDLLSRDALFHHLLLLYLRQGICLMFSHCVLSFTTKLVNPIEVRLEQLLI